LLGLAPIDRNRPKHSKADEEAKQNIQARERKLNLEAKIGKTEVTQGLGSNKQPGYYCQHCDVTLKDSASWLDHINSKRRK
jgi:U4/U6.U5 tri-snRNP component SNU23